MTETIEIKPFKEIALDHWRKVRQLLDEVEDGLQKLGIDVPRAEKPERERAPKKPKHEPPPEWTRWESNNGKSMTDAVLEAAKSFSKDWTKKDILEWLKKHGLDYGASGIGSAIQRMKGKEITEVKKGGRGIPGYYRLKHP